MGALGTVLDCWSGLLDAYAQGQEALDDSVSSALDGLPLAGASGLGAWAAGALREAVRAAGLAPAELDALKPVLVNSAHVAERDEVALPQAAKDAAADLVQRTADGLRGVYAQVTGVRVWE